MTYDQIISLGWVNRNPDSTNKVTFSFKFPSKQDSDYYIMSYTFSYDEGFDLVYIKLVDSKTHVNIWENSETYFYGVIKKAEELDLVM